MLNVMDGTILQTAGLIVLGWLVLAVLVGAGLAVFLSGARRLEREAPSGKRAIRAWVRAGRHGRRRSRRAA
jgi:hypothetical protein